MKMNRVSGCILVFVVICTSGNLAFSLSRPALEITYAGHSIRTKLAWLDFGQVVSGTKNVEVEVQNVSQSKLTVDAFSWSPALRAFWLEDNPQGTRATFSPGEQKTLMIQAQFSNTPNTEGAFAISLMSGGNEITTIAAKALVRPTNRLTVYKDQRPSAFWFSGLGEWWSDWYVLSLGEAVPGYTLDPSSVKYNVMEFDAHTRRCGGTWAVCELTEADQKDVSVRFTVQGHHYRDWDGTSHDRPVRSTGCVSGDYVLDQSTTLASAEESVSLSSLLPGITNVWYNTSKGVLPKSNALQQMYLSSQGDGAQAAAPADLTRDCGRAIVQACLELASWTLVHNPATSNADTLLKNACDTGAGAACTTLSSRTTIEPDRIALLQKGCDLKDGHACYLLGLRYKEGPQSNPQASRTFTARACKLHFPAAGCKRVPR